MNSVEIVWYGHSCFRLRDKNVVVATDPYSEELSLALPKIKADIVTISHHHADHAYLKAIKGEPKIIEGPGEYEIRGLFITGIPSFHDRRKGKDRGKNTIYLFEFEDLTICHLGDLGHVPTQEQVEDLSDIDVLLVPVGAHSTIGAGEASEVISLLEPRVVIPMHYRIATTKKVPLDPLDNFLKVMGMEATPQESLRLSRGSLPEETQVIILQNKG